jgi:flagellin
LGSATIGAAGDTMVRVSGSYAYVPDVYTETNVVDISNPSSPTLVATLSSSGKTYDTEIYSKYAYVPCSNGIKIYNISNPALPSLAGSYSGSGVGKLSINHGKIYATELNAGVYDLITLDISNPINPKLIGRYSNISSGFPDVLSVGNKVFVGCQSEGFKVFSSEIDISLAGTANSSLNSLDEALNKVNRTRAKIGGYISRMDSVITNVKSMSTNLSSSRAAIVDADYAQETANLSRAQILQQAATAMVAQANMQSQAVMALLKNI